MTRQRTRIAALVAGCAIVAGGAYAATDALSSPAPAAAAAGQQPGAASSAQPASGAAGAATSTEAGQPAAAAALSSAITDIAAPSSTPAQRVAQLRRVRRALRRLRLLGGEHGEFTFRTRQGTRTLAFERGTIVSVAGSDVTVRAADNTTWTWVLTSASVVRDDGSRASASALSAGEPVFAGGPVTGAAHDARLIVVRESASAKSGTSGTSTASLPMLDRDLNRLVTGLWSLRAPVPVTPRWCASAGREGTCSHVVPG
jgi:hypothetical protein